ncbi:hypothetical protein ALC152_05780 [Arcobacter sp. 15-2]|uniref:hypothetical protein n=1 Tax=Arcobacter sp. 15-2 TaxID=3374109 RepID=UPI00399D3581
MNIGQEKLKSILLTNEIFIQIINSSLSDIEYIYLSGNPHLTQSQIDYLFLQNIDSVNINLLRNENCSKTKIEKFINLDDKIYNIAIAHNRTISQDIIAKLMAFNDADVKHSLKFNNLI